MNLQHVIFGKRVVKVRSESGHRVKVQKKAHIVRGGRSICKAENAYKHKPRMTFITMFNDDQVCKNCLDLLSREQPAPVLK